MRRAAGRQRRPASRRGSRSSRCRSSLGAAVGARPGRDVAVAPPVAPPRGRRGHPPPVTATVAETSLRPTSAVAVATTSAASAGRRGRSREPWPFSRALPCATGAAGRPPRPAAVTWAAAAARVAATAAATAIATTATTFTALADLGSRCRGRHRGEVEGRGDTGRRRESTVARLFVPRDEDGGDSSSSDASGARDVDAALRVLSRKGRRRRQRLQPRSLAGRPVVDDALLL